MLDKQEAKPTFRLLDNRRISANTIQRISSGQNVGFPSSNFWFVKLIVQTSYKNVYATETSGPMRRLLKSKDIQASLSKRVIEKNLSIISFSYPQGGNFSVRVPLILKPFSFRSQWVPLRDLSHLCNMSSFVSLSWPFTFFFHDSWLLFKRF